MPAHAHAALILPFTPSLLSDPAPILGLLADLPSRATESVLVYFTSPTPSRTATARSAQLQPQLYDVLRADPRAHWAAFQRFLSLVYSTLAAAQWAAGRIGMSVDVGFAGEEGRWEGRMGRCTWVGVLSGHEDLPSPSFSCAPTTLPCPSLLSPSSASPFPFSNSAIPTPTLPMPRRIPVVALGGTFDHLHAAHKLLLHLALFLAGRRLIVGVISPALLAGKAHAGLVESLERRLEGVRGFLTCLGGRVEGEGEGEDEDEVQRVSLYLTEIHDAFGPTAYDADIQALVISDETRSGGAAVNDLRRDKGLSELEVWCIEVISARRAVGAVRAASGSGSGSGSVAEAEADTDEGDGSNAADIERSIPALRVDSPSDPDPTASRGASVRAESLAGMDEKTLKEVKMGSTGIRAWLAQRERERERERTDGGDGGEDGQ